MSDLGTNHSLAKIFSCNEHLKKSYCHACHARGCRSGLWSDESVSILFKLIIFGDILQGMT